MSTTVAIPAEIVGDTETLHRRRDRLDRDLVIAALCAGRNLRDGVDPVPRDGVDPVPRGHLDVMAELTPAHDALTGEIRRRMVARDLAYADEPSRQFAQGYVRSGR